MDLKLAELMLKFIAKVCNKYNGLNIAKYINPVSKKETYKLEFWDC